MGKKGPERKKNKKGQNRVVVLNFKEWQYQFTFIFAIIL